MKSIISELKIRRLITNLLGSIPSKIRPALAVLARKKPKDSFLAFVALSEAITNEPLVVFVDDLCSQLVMERTQIELGRHVPVSEFRRCLPENKRQDFNELTLDKILHLLLELSLLKQVTKECNLLLVGHFSQAIVVCHRKTSQNPISAVSIPRLNSREEIDDYKRRIANTLRGIFYERICPFFFFKYLCGRQRKSFIKISQNFKLVICAIFFTICNNKNNANFSVIFYLWTRADSNR